VKREIISTTNITLKAKKQPITQVYESMKTLFPLGFLTF
jgi:hypothetical protein